MNKKTIKIASFFFFDKTIKIALPDALVPSFIIAQNNT